MTEDIGICDLTVVSLQDNEPEAEMEDGETATDHPMKTNSKLPEETSNCSFSESMDSFDDSGNSVTSTSTNNPKSDSNPSSMKVCAVHDTELDWFCGSEGKLICSHCAIVGPCQGHTVTPLGTQVTAVRVSKFLYDMVSHFHFKVNFWSSLLFFFLDCSLTTAS